jgi:hypothetical protein
MWLYNLKILSQIPSWSLRSRIRSINKFLRKRIRKDSLFCWIEFICENVMLINERKRFEYALIQYQSETEKHNDVKEQGRKFTLPTFFFFVVLSGEPSNYIKEDFDLILRVIKGGQLK